LRKKGVRLLLVNVVLLALLGAVGEVGCRLFWSPKYWVHAENWWIGSGNDRAGKKWWPGASYRVESAEFRVRFRTNALGYRERPEAVRTADPYRIAFVGDSFTEAMQVDVADTFVARLERGLAPGAPREVVCENFGVSATGPFDYWHRIVHDVFRPGATPPGAVVLCLYPGNDFTEELPDAGFAPDGSPRREYFRESGWLWHAATWLNVKSKLGHYLVRSAVIASMRSRPPGDGAPKYWWTDPELARSAAEAQPVARSRSLLRAIEAECCAHGTKLVVLVIGPVPTYIPKDARSPLGQVLADWGIEAPVIDVAAPAIVAPTWPQLLFPGDGHLNELGHAYVASAALEPLRAALGPAPGPLAAAPGAPGRR
jgi:hypothetical protein